MKKKYIAVLLFILLFLSSISFVFAQKTEDELTVERIEKEISQKTGSQQSRQKSVDSYIQTAKTERDYYKLYNGYLLSTINNPGNRQYADSLIDAAIRNKDNRLIALAYQSSGVVLVETYDYSKALEHLLLSLEYFEKNESKEWVNVSNNYIGIIKMSSGDYIGAQRIFDETYKYYKWKIETKNTISNNNRLLSSTVLLAQAEAYLQKFDESSKLLREAQLLIDKNPNLNRGKDKYYTALGIVNLQQHKFSQAIQSFKNSLRESADPKDNIKTNFYLAVSYWKNNQHENAFSYFKTVENKFTETSNMPVKFRSMFEFFIEYYKNKGDREKQLEYVDKLLNYDKSYNVEQKNIDSRIQTDYDEKKLLQEKEKIENKRIKERWAFSAAVILLIIGIVFYSIYRRRKMREQRSENSSQNPNSSSLLQDSTQNETAEKHKVPENDNNFTESDLIKTGKIIDNEAENSNLENPKSNDDIANVPLPQNTVLKEIDYEAYLPINKASVKHILKNLESFEKNKKFLRKNIRLVDIASEFSTNEKYLARAIKVKTGKIFNHYINDLRLAHLKDLINEDPSTTQKKVKDISNYLGYSSPEAFTAIFRERFGVPPSVYFKEETNQNDDSQ